MNKNLTFKESNKNRQNVPIDDVSGKTAPTGEIGIRPEKINFWKIFIRLKSL